MEYKKELDRLTEFAEKIMQINDTAQKEIGLNNLLNKVKDTVSDVVTGNAEAINKTNDWRFRDYTLNIDSIQSTYNSIIRFVNEHIADIIAYENETTERQKQRKAKLKQCSKTVSISPIETVEWDHHYNRYIKKTKPHPDSIYCERGSYRRFDNYSNDKYHNTFYRLCLSIKRGFEFSQEDFRNVCRLVCLYVALKNELNVVKEEMQLLGMRPKTIQPNAETQDKPQQPPHFTRLFTDDEKKKLFDNLIKNDFLPKVTIYGHFCYVFGGRTILDNEKPFKQLQWTGSIKELNYFISKHLPKEKNQWEKAVKCFLWNSESINKNSLSTAIDKYDNPPDRSTIIDDLLS